LSVLVLHALTRSLFGYETPSQKAFCLVSAALHVLSPAGAFLSAPYGESLFSLLNLTGFYLYSAALSSESAGRRGRRDIHFLLAGAAFAVATTIRGNGILSGCLFAYDAIQGALQFLRHGLSLDLLRRTGFVVVGGITVALGTIIPQFIAFTEYCEGATSRPWCDRLVPSIYGWVQAHYW
jgi:GPI mannosyltransferase 2